MKKAILFILITSTTISKAQTYQSQQIGLYFYNATLGGIIGGIGAIINNPKDEKKSKAFLRGFSRGFIGGSVNYGAKLSSTLIKSQKTISFAIPTKIIHSFGTSIINNAALNKKFMEVYSINIAMVNLQYDNTIKARIMPTATIGTIICATQGKFKAKESLQMLTPYFESRNETFNSVGSIAINRTQITSLNRDYHEIISHEIIHSLQHYEYISFNTFLSKPDKKLKNKNWYSKASDYIYADIPYASGIYEIMNIYRNINKKSLYNTNFFEFEAHSFSQNKYLKRKK